MISAALGGGQSHSSNDSYIWNEQTPFLTDLYEQGQSLYQDQSPQIKEYSTNFVNQNAPHLQDVTSGLMDTSFTGGVKEGSNLGMGSMANFMSPQENPYLDFQINRAMGDIGRNLNENILTGNASEAGLANQFGGSRHSLSDAMSKEEALRLGSQTAESMRGAAYGDDMNRALDASRGYVTAGMTADQLEANRLGMVGDSVTDSYNLGMSPYESQWMPMNQYSATVGGPTTLNSGRSSAWNASGSGSFGNFGG